MRNDVDFVQRATQGGHPIVLGTDGAPINAERTHALGAAGLPGMSAAP
jgi:hypothetical protein